MPQLAEALKERGREDIILVCGGVIPRQDYAYLMENGVSAVFGPGTHVLDAARAILDLIEGKRRNL
ncbi:protein sbm, partial [Sinorhizobium medicae]